MSSLCESARPADTGQRMSTYDLIPDEIYDTLPEEDVDRFVILVRTAQANLQRMLDNSSSSDFSDELRDQFVATIKGCAEALGVDGLGDLTPTSRYSDYAQFQVRLAGIVARTRLRGNLLSKPHSVELGNVTRAKIRQEIEQLRVYIGQTDLSDKKQAALNDKLDELLVELDHRRLSFARTMAIAASIMGTVGGTAGAIAAAPKIPAGVSYILSLVGQDKATEEAERERLAPPPLAIAGPKDQPAQGFGFDDDLDDDVPF